MNVKEAILKRRSIRKFKEDKISEDKIQILLECAMAAPSACNKKPWAFYVITNEEVLEKLRTSSRYTGYKSPLNIIVCGDKSKALSDKPNDFWIQDVSSAIENILVEAVELDLGTCWCGLYPMDHAVENVKNILDMPENIIPLGLIHIGYPAEEKESRTQFDDSCVKYIK